MEVDRQPKIYGHQKEHAAEIHEVHFEKMTMRSSQLRIANFINSHDIYAKICFLP